MTHQVESFVNCAVAENHTIETSTDGASWTAVVVASGYHRFGAFLNLLTAGVTDYTFTYDATADRVKITPAAVGTLYFRFSTSLAKTLGFSSATTAKITTEATGDLPPAGIVPLKSVSIVDSSPATKSKLNQFSHGRARGLVFGKGVMHRAKTLVSYEQLERLMSGPCTVGHIRIGSTAATTPYQSTALGGYVEGHLVRVGVPRSIDTVEGVAELEIGIHAQTYTAPVETSASALEFDPFFGSLQRGFSLGYYVRISGIPYTFTQGIDPGWTDANRPTSTTLIIHETTSIKHRIDRQNGWSMSGPVQFGIFDPDNDLSLFGRPTKTTEIVSGVTAAQTTVDVADVSGWGSSGAFWLGTEYVKYSGVDASANQFTGLTRGAINDKTLFYAGGSAAYGTVSDRPHIWSGRTVELWAVLLDPYGNAIGDAWDNADGCRQMWTGEVAGPPGYDGGVWTVHANPLINRLATELGPEATGQTAENVEMAGYTVFADGVSPLVVIRDSAASDGDGATEAHDLLVSAIWEPTGDQKNRPVFSSFSAVAPYGTPQAYATDTAAGVMIVDYYTAIQSVFDQIRYDTQLGPNTEIGADLNLYHWQVFVTEFQVLDDNTHVFRVWNDGDTAGQCSQHLLIKIGPAPGSDCRWWPRTLQFRSEDVQNDVPTGKGFANVSANQSGNARLNHTGATGKNIDSIVLSAEPDSENLLGTWPASGYAVINDQELVKYTGRIDASTESGYVGLYGVTRGLAGTEPVDVWEGGVKVVSVQSLDNTFGKQMLTLAQSSGTATRGTFDTEPISDGYGMNTDHIDESSFLSFVDWETTTLLANKTSFKKTYATMLGGLRRVVSPIRKDQRLKLGCQFAQPIGIPHVTLRDDDLRLDKGPTVQRVGLGPNLIDIKIQPVPGLDIGSSKTYRLLADIAARGGIRHQITIPGIFPTIFQTLAQNIGAAYMLNTMDLVAYRFQVGPNKDWLPAQVVDINITHPAVWDWAADATGLSAVGVILEVNRRLSGECDLVVVVGGSGLPGALCPAVAVTNRTGDNLTISETAFPDGRPIFLSGDPVLIYQAGVDGNYTETTATTVSGSTMTVAAVPGWVGTGAIATASGVYVTYPNDQNASITADQDRFVHYSDGTIWI